MANLISKVCFFKNHKYLLSQINIQVIFIKSQYHSDKNIIVRMDRKDYTPTKQSKLFTASTNYNPIPPRETLRPNAQFAITREYQALKLQARQLEIQNRQLLSDVQKLKYQKTLHENKLQQKASFEQQALSQFQKEKSYQIEMLKIKNQEDLNRLRREYQLKIEDTHREIQRREILNKEMADKNNYAESKACELRNNLQNLQMELLRYRDSNSVLTEQLTREEFANKKLEMLQQELERQKNQMQTEIHILLDIQAEKSRDISNLEFQLQTSENSEKTLQQKLALLTDNFISLEQHITMMKDRLGNADMQGQEINKQLQSVEYMIAQREQLILQQKDRELRLRQQIDLHRERESRRIFQIEHLMTENERVYSDLVSLRHRLYEVSIQQGIDI